MRFFILALILTSCSNECYCGYFSDVTDYDISGEYIFSPGGIKIYPNENIVDIDLIDKKVEELEQCLGIKIKRDCFKVYIPNDWYISTCSEEQLIPSIVDPQLCRDKGLEIKPECEWVMYPTEECPCPCNIRSGIQDNNVIITTPDLKLFKMPLTRIVIYPEYLMDNEDYQRCAWN